MGDQPLHVLFLCTHNSARSILAEALTNHMGGSRVRAYSAGSFPRCRVHPGALMALEWRGIPTRGLSSKSWDRFTQPDAPTVDVVITVCDAAAGEVCPIWPGAPLKGHWGMEDPATLARDKDAGEVQRIFLHALDAMEQRLRAFLKLPFGELARDDLVREIARIGGMPIQRE